MENMVVPALRKGGYHYRNLVRIGLRFGANRPHIIDGLAWDDNGAVHFLSCKWQQTQGTAEQKVPFEVMCLVSVVMTKPVLEPDIACLDCGEMCPSIPSEISAYLILGGEGWKLRQFYVSGGLEEYMPDSNLVEITTLEAFVAQANRGLL